MLEKLGAAASFSHQPSMGSDASLWNSSALSLSLYGNFIPDEARRLESTDSKQDAVIDSQTRRGGCAGRPRGMRLAAKNTEHSLTNGRGKNADGGR
jgi:hypothetical protein